jgi:hypothetical protein
LLEQVEITFIPLLNPVGFYRDEADERLSDEAIEKLRRRGLSMESVDILTDFPYDQDQPNNCLKSISARILFKLATENAFDASIQLHGGGNFIGHPWGSPSKVSSIGLAYESYLTPDNVAYTSIGAAMAERAGSFNFLEDVTFSAVNYRVGPVGTEMQPKRGRFMDWVYAAGWDRDETTGYNDYCSPWTYDLEEDGIFFTGSGNQNSVKALSFQVEMDVNKNPPEKTLGGRYVSFTDTTNARNITGIFAGENGEEAASGHVNRNLRLLTQFI